MPVMGAAAFIMANFLNVPYAEVMLAAILPSPYYAALFLQTDLYAVRNGLMGVSKEEVPPLLPTLMSGWYYLAAIAGLTFLLLAFRIEAEAPSGSRSSSCSSRCCGASPRASTCAASAGWWWMRARRSRNWWHRSPASD